MTIGPGTAQLSPRRSSFGHWNPVRASDPNPSRKLINVKIIIGRILGARISARRVLEADDVTGVSGDGPPSPAAPRSLRPRRSGYPQSVND